MCQQFHSNVESADEIMSKIMDDETKSEILLQRIVKLKKDFIVCPTFHNFSPPTEDEEMKQDWENGLKMTSDKFFAQVCTSRIRHVFDFHHEYTLDYP